MTTPRNNNGGTAFPGKYEYVEGNLLIDGYSPGMTLRDWFAGMALQGCIEWERLKGVDSLLGDEMPPHSQPLTMDDDIDDGDQSTSVAKAAYMVADAMLAARKEGA